MLATKQELFDTIEKLYGNDNIKEKIQLAMFEKIDDFLKERKDELESEYNIEYSYDKFDEAFNILYELQENIQTTVYNRIIEDDFICNFSDVEYALDNATYILRDLKSVKRYVYDLKKFL